MRICPSGRVMAGLAATVVLAISVTLIACGGSSGGQGDKSPGASPGPKGKPILTLVGDTKTVKLSLADLKAMPKYSGWAGIKTSVGTLIAPAKYAGVPVADLAKLVGGISKDNGVTILAKDGYGMTLSYDQIYSQDFTTFDPATGEEEPPTYPLTVILAYERDGKLLDPDMEGPLRLQVAQPKPAQLVDGHWTVKWADKVEVKAATSDWIVKLNGAVDSQITRISYTSCSSPGCHGKVWADKAGTLWQGIPLWLAVGMVDDQQKHDKGAFNRRLARAGETVEVRAADGTTTTLSAQEIFKDQEILLSAKMSGEELPEEYFPVRLVGPGLTQKQMVGHVIKVVVLPSK
jgi:DMSO/TMAO reductase YedYZ molybdopterin-dependent catalytic subunit